MSFPKRQPSKEALKAIDENDPAAPRMCREELQKMTGHTYSTVTKSGGEAIERTFSCLKGPILLPDQGIWKGVKAILEDKGLPFETVETDMGLVSPQVLEEKLESGTFEAFFLSSFAGYIAAQDMPHIHRVCKDHGVLVIEDASPAIGHPMLGKADHAHVVLGSARHPKLLNLPVGGFITTTDTGFIEGLEAQAIMIQPPGVWKSISIELKRTGSIIREMIKLSESLKGPLGSAVLHKDSMGICVGLLVERPKGFMKKAREQGLLLEGGASIISTCPRYDRFLSKGLVLETKKLDPWTVDIELLEHKINQCFLGL